MAGITAKDGAGPQVAPAIAWLRGQAGDLTVILGGRNIASAPRTLQVSLNGAALTEVAMPVGFFVSRFNLPADAFSSGGSYQPLEVRTTAGGLVSLEQFDAQPAGVPMFSFNAGWQEPEYNPETSKSWRWMSERAELWVRPIGRAVTLSLTGESPKRYYDSAPHVRVLAGDREIAAFDPAADFEQSITLTPDVLAAAGGRVTIESSKFFVPAERGSGADQRHLAMRIYQVHVE